MLAPRQCNVCGKQWNADTAATPAGPVLETRVGRSTSVLSAPVASGQS
ncbi:hypothetical protein [Xanthomonas oryzae]|uniref:Uncharacterized protein n=2 Tax=Xanthomonas oryzae TaxID=347 RepID=A0AAJ6KLR4_9XANT|nr:hypothetical protein [Xanthomonas oryzae]UNE62629.1 hypothetical protein MML47_21285 [Xanthomonas oryzae]WIX06823.1 hypothetical protein QN060_00955 [Xanthomonas oryzae pv. oryzae]